MRSFSSTAWRGCAIASSAFPARASKRAALKDATACSAASRRRPAAWRRRSRSRLVVGLEASPPPLPAPARRRPASADREDRRAVVLGGRLHSPSGCTRTSEPAGASTVSPSISNVAVPFRTMANSSCPASPSSVSSCSRMTSTSLGARYALVPNEVMPGAVGRRSAAVRRPVAPGAGRRGLELVQLRDDVGLFGCGCHRFHSYRVSALKRGSFRNESRSLSVPDVLLIDHRPRSPAADARSHRPCARALASMQATLKDERLGRFFEHRLERSRAPSKCLAR